MKNLLDNTEGLCSNLMSGDGFKKELDNEGVAYEEVDKHGGEGEGDDYFRIYKFTDGAEVVFVRFQGWYASYHGSEYSGYYFVEPEEKSIIVYVDV